MSSKSPRHQQHLANLISQGSILEQDGHGPKVVELDGGSIIKLFRQKSHLSRYRFWPAASRFAKNLKKLRNKGIPCPETIESFRYPGGSAIHYKTLPGHSLRQVARRGEMTPELAKKVGAFLATLHDKGILFRSVHPGNIIVQPDGTLGLIDVLDILFIPFPLLRSQRIRNWKHFLRTPHEDPSLNSNYLQPISEHYALRSPINRLVIDTIEPQDFYRKAQHINDCLKTEKTAFEK